MARSLSSLSIGVLALTVSGCGGGGTSGTPSTCTFSVQMTRHPGMFHGAGVVASGGSFSVDVTASPATCTVPTYTPDSWITIVSQAPDDPQTYNITASANTGATRRTGTAYVGFQALTVDQAGTGGSGCTFQLMPATASYTAAGGTGAFVLVASDARCGWDADRSATGEDWSSEPRPLRGVGTTGVVFDVRSSTAAPQPPLPRQAQMTVRDSAGTIAATQPYQQQ